MVKKADRVVFKITVKSILKNFFVSNKPIISYYHKLFFT